MSWCDPKDINRTVTEGAVREQWVYATGGYIYVTDDVVSAMQN